MKFYRSAWLRFKALFKSTFRAFRVGSTALAAMVLFSSFHSIAQQSVYADSAQKRGKVPALQWGGLPSSIPSSFRIRGRTEGQTSLNYAGNGDRIDKLTGDHAAIEISPPAFSPPIFSPLIPMVDTLSYTLAKAPWTPGIGGQFEDTIGNNPT